MNVAQFLVMLVVPLGVFSIEIKPNGELPSDRTKKDVTQLKEGETLINNKLRKSLSIGGDSYLPPTSYQGSFGGGCQCYNPQQPVWNGLIEPVPSPIPPQVDNYYRYSGASFYTGPSSGGLDYQRAPQQYNPQYTNAWRTQNVPNSVGITSTGYYYDVPNKRFDS